MLSSSFTNGACDTSIQVAVRTGRLSDLALLCSILDFQVASGFFKSLLDSARERLRLHEGVVYHSRVAYRLGVALVQACVVGTKVKRAFRGSLKVRDGVCIPRKLDDDLPEAVVNGVNEVDLRLAVATGSNIPEELKHVLSGAKLNKWIDLLHRMLAVSLLYSLINPLHMLCSFSMPSRFRNSMTNGYGAHPMRSRSLAL